MAKNTIHTLEEIYSEGAVKAQKERYEKSAEEFKSIFGDSGSLRYFSAPGRTEVGGNHTAHRACHLIHKTARLAEIFVLCILGYLGYLYSTDTACVVDTRKDISDKYFKSGRT